jgi:EAL domain-containing protein (putative c-di-GMP-specific phosphodiesterase class I)
MNARVLEMVAMERSLRDAMLKEQFRLHYQGQVDGESRAITGAEALIRWQHPELGLLGPGRFIEVAEERGMIEPIGEWVLRTACLQAKAWLDAGHQLRIAVNVSPIQLRKGRLFDSVLLALHDSGLPPANLALEITESAVMEDIEAAAEMLQRLYGLGVQIEIDDFGTGHSSLAYLKQLPIERLKIDQSFVRAVPGDADSEAIVDAIIGLATSLRLEIIAEGVETEAQRHFLLERGCRAMQGYYFCRPLPPDEFEARLRTSPKPGSSSTATEQL